MAGLPFLASAWLNTATLNKGISDRVTANVAAIGASWAKLTFDGRDVKLGGDAPDDNAIDAAMAAITGTYGVRTLSDVTRVVAPLPPATVTTP